MVSCARGGITEKAKGNLLRTRYAQDVQAAGRKYFPGVVAVGEENLIRDDLAPFGFEFRKAQ
jgi:hypothetical protein